MSIKVMTKVWEWSKAEGSSLLVMLALADHADDDGACYPGVERIARKCRISPRSVQRHIKELEESGELRVDIGRGVTVQGGATNRYRITVNNGERLHPQRGDKLTGGDKSLPEVVTKSLGSGDTALSPKPSEESSVSEPSTPMAPKGAEGSSHGTKMSGFEDFWKEYPKKKAKGAAVKAWMNRGCAKIVEEIMLALSLQKGWVAWTKKEGQYIPHPASWLNARGWEDEEKTQITKPQAPARKGF